MRDLDNIEVEALNLIRSIEKLDALDSLRVNYLGKSGSVTLQMKNIASLPPDERKSFGAKLNSVKETIASATEARKSELWQIELGNRLKTETVDVTLPARPIPQGRIHPV